MCFGRLAKLAVKTCAFRLNGGAERYAAWRGSEVPCPADDEYIRYFASR